jgi:hypothetical protein
VAAPALAGLVYTSSFLALPARPRTNRGERLPDEGCGSVARDAAARGMPIVSLLPGVIYGPGAATEGNLVGRLVRDHLEGRLPGIGGPSVVVLMCR